MALNSDNFVVGRWIGAASLGLYSRAYTLMNLPFTYASAVMSSVLFPAFAQVQGEPPRVRRAYLLLTQLTAMVAASAMATMAVVAPHFVRALYGSRWNGAVLPLQILCVAGYFRALYHLGGVVAQSVGRVYGELRNQTIYAGLVIAGALIGSRFDLPGVAVGVSGAILFMFLATGAAGLECNRHALARVSSRPGGRPGHRRRHVQRRAGGAARLGVAPGDQRRDHARRSCRCRRAVEHRYAADAGRAGLRTAAPTAAALV